MADRDFSEVEHLAAMELPGGKRLRLRRLRIRKRPCVDLRLFMADARGETPTKSGFAVACERWPEVAAFVAQHAHVERPLEPGGPPPAQPNPPILCAPARPKTDQMR